MCTCLQHNEGPVGPGALAVKELAAVTVVQMCQCHRKLLMLLLHHDVECWVCRVQAGAHVDRGPRDSPDRGPPRHWQAKLPNKDAKADAQLAAEWL
jgi:hypothetical protein